MQTLKGRRYVFLHLAEYNWTKTYREIRSGWQIQDLITVFGLKWKNFSIAISVIFKRFIFWTKRTQTNITASLLTYAYNIHVQVYLGQIPSSYTLVSIKYIWRNFHFIVICQCGLNGKKKYYTANLMDSSG